MPGLKPTEFELDMQKEGLIDGTGKIIKGALKDTGLYITDHGYDKDGNLQIEIGDIINIKAEDYIKLTIPKEKFHSYKHTKNLMELTAIDAVCKHIAEPMTRYILAKASDFTQEIYKTENAGVFDGTKASLKTRQQNAVKYYTQGRFTTPQETFEALESMPETFLKDEQICSVISTDVFSKLNREAKRFDTPEAIISLRAVATQTMVDLMDKLNDKGFYKSAKSFESGLIKFDEQFEYDRER